MKIQKPGKRNGLRSVLGRYFYISKRKTIWLFSRNKWAKPGDELKEEHLVFAHKSLILRPLKDVEMYLQENKRKNLSLAIDKLNLCLIKPGETFSIWKLVGKPSASKGYLEGLVLNQGKIEKGIGGGLCQLGNLLFWIFAHSPLDITERHRHAFDVFPDVNRSIPFGSGATLSYNYIDLQVVNNTSSEFQVKLWMDEDFLYGSLNSNHPIMEKYEIDEQNHRFEQQHWGGHTRHNQLVKIVTDKNGIRKQSLLVENHALLMYSPFLASETQH